MDLSAISVEPPDRRRSASHAIGPSAVEVIRMSESGKSAGGTDQCNVCGGGETDHHLCVATEGVFGASVWVYDDGYARVVPTVTRSLVTGTDR